ncbi:Gfo/Idh/MocA family protein [Breznakiella homolactica]|uniref:Gfo/Idh/MocA family oxidoreductase n=1 Tax=Breznakiella homolactica TaxID=2798577 RepID=A0A7T7XRE9_9SPIR|nr:Gfo/Idh/MocA family oxidoreductase [Breznakiella homolactica]QQO11108.1 Gfo/Idh/MocA family oxidoreductase [Breznakiella homolactica]
MEKIPVAVIGLGRIASLLEDDPLREKPCTHAGAIAANPECSLAAGADTDGERRELFSERWNCPVYGDAETMLAEHRPRILHIATHPDSHAHYCRLAALHGTEICVCEKPLADTLGRSRAIAQLHNHRKIKIITNHERRYSEDYIQAKSLLDSRALGEPLSVKAVLYMGKTRRLLDVLWHDGTHLADAAMFLSGGVLKHERRTGTRLTEREGTAYLTGRLEPPPGAGDKVKPLPFLMEVGAGRDHIVFELEFSCSEGRLRIGNGIFEVWKSVPSPYAEGFRSLKKEREGFAGKTGYFSNMVADAVLCLRNPSLEPRSSAQDGIRVIEYLNSVQRWKQ